jgi:hypothetical protein
LSPSSKAIFRRSQRSRQARGCLADPIAVKKIQAQAEKIVVQNAPVRVDVRLERGGSISGVIRYDDGNPAPDVKAIRMVMQEDGKWMVDTFNPSMPAPETDDRGHYRISGLPKGKYAVRADLPTNQSTTGLGPGSFDMHPNTAMPWSFIPAGSFNFLFRLRQLRNNRGNFIEYLVPALELTAVLRALHGFISNEGELRLAVSEILKEGHVVRTVDGLMFYS